MNKKNKERGDINGLSTYVISDIHGCYKEFLLMLDKIGFSAADTLIGAGDYIERGLNSYEMLKWIEHCPDNVWLVRGNHEEEFASYVDLMFQLDREEELNSDFNSNQEAIVLYETVKYLFKKKGLSDLYFDLYGTIHKLLSDSGVNLNDLCRWAELIRKMPYFYKTVIKDRSCIVVHAGYAEKLEDISFAFSSLEQFYLYARKESCQLGGKTHGMIIAGHTPTIIKDEFFYNKGDVFRYYDKEKDCVFYNIDCGSVFRDKTTGAKLACIRLEDEKIFYI